MIKEIIIKEAAKRILALALSQVKKIDINLTSSEDEVRSALFNHIIEVKNWAGEVTFKDMKAARNINEIYVDLDFFLFPRRDRISDNEEISKVSIKKIFEVATRHVAILGQPGAGKTTSMKYLCRSILFDENFYHELFDYPILLKLRELNSAPRKSNSKSILVDHLFNTLGLSIENNDKIRHDALYNLKERIVVDCLNKIPCLVIIDGFDELVFQKDRNLVLSELEKLANYIEKSRIVITSRTADYIFKFENVSSYELCPLSEEQIIEFAEKWLCEKELANAFLKAVKKSPFNDTTIRPLTIAHLCAIYERVGKIPDKPKTIYRKIITLLLEEWDEQRNVKRLSRYGAFEIDRKLEFLSSIAYHLTITTQTTTFNKKDLKIIYGKICEDFDLEKSQEQNVLREIESHTGLFIESSFETYEFAHKSLQEYLAADYIVKLPKIPIRKNLIERLSNEMAIAISISSNPSDYFCEFVTGLLPVKFSFRFIRAFVNRILLEKPEFNRSPKIGFFAMCLYSRYINIHETPTQLSLFVVDDLIKEFEDLINTIYKRSPADEIMKLYKIDSMLDSTNGTKILQLSLKNEITRKWNVDLPKMLLSRESFFNGAIND
jgi:predicted NACHT family NTPase